jgi:hypothetical protein
LTRLRNSHFKWTKKWGAGHLWQPLMSQIRDDLVRCQELGRRQDALAAKIEMFKRGIRPIAGGSPEATRFIPSEQDIEDVFGSPSCGDDAQFMNAAG